MLTSNQKEHKAPEELMPMFHRLDQMKRFMKNVLEDPSILKGQCQYEEPFFVAYKMLDEAIKFKGEHV
jgi:hypothetical protein